ncbi:MAG: hypothetical protein PHW73_01010 [Atribacterota bacterium]|nr:hypothetical protein [Atribacterota bacterium]
MNDISIYECGNGGELSLKNGDIETTDGLFNMPYLGHFGGNTEASTTGNEQEGEERYDWWGNQLLEEQHQMNSSLESSLNEITLNSAGRVKIEREAKKDIEFMAEFADVDCQVSIQGLNKIVVSDKINQAKIDMIWNATKDEIIEEITI